MGLHQFDQSGRTQFQRRDDETAGLCCATARGYEDRGEYTNALSQLLPFCKGIGVWPDTDGLSLPLEAEVLLRAGVLSGWIGSAEAIEGAGEAAEQLISAASNVFNQLGLITKVGECHIELGWCHWRAGRFVEAANNYHAALNSLQSEDDRLRAKAYLRLAISHRSAKQYRDALAILETHRPIFDALDVGDIIRAGAHNELAVIHKNLASEEDKEGHITKAFREYSKSLFHGKKARHKRHCAIVENNKGILHLQLRQFERAFAHTDRAIRLFISLGDFRSVCQVEESRAQVLIQQGMYAEAESKLKRTIRTLEKAGEQSLLCETLITCGIALARQGKRTEAYNTLSLAADIATAVGDNGNAGRANLAMLEEYQYLKLNTDQLVSAYSETVHWLEATQDKASLARLHASTGEILRSVVLQAMPSESGSGEFQELKGLPLKEAVRRFKSIHIKVALDAAKGNVSEAARTLGMTPSGLHELLNGTHAADRDPRSKRYAKSGMQPVNEIQAYRAKKQSETTLPLKPESLHVHIPTDHLASLGPREGDWVVAEAVSVKDGDLVVVELTTGEYAVGRLQSRKDSIILHVYNLHFEPSIYGEDEVVRITGKAYGWYKAGEESLDHVRRFIYG